MTTSYLRCFSQASGTTTEQIRHLKRSATTSSWQQTENFCLVGSDHICAIAFILFTYTMTKWNEWIELIHLFWTFIERNENRKMPFTFKERSIFKYLFIHVQKGARSSKQSESELVSYEVPQDSVLGWILLYVILFNVHMLPLGNVFFQ